jgi:Transcriptional regulators
MSIIKFIEEELPKLSRQERKVAIKVMKDPEQVQKMSISVLAKSTQVSNATITRFVKKMNCHDFYEFKLQLANDLAKKEPTIKPDSISSEVYNFYNNVLDSTAQRIDPDQLKKVVNLISNGQRIYLFGIGSSGYTASEMTQRLLRMGISAFAMTDSDIMYISSSLMNENDVVLALSSSGGTDDINNAIAIAQSNGAKVIGITSFNLVRCTS